ncbi:benzoate/H(+) symporter BenE family transporter [Lacisediminihabitans changchengi]|uniref:Benzoate/H(+) symporter BenE family transporter n=1 Tax=Lacisediminihabitans changchengi TaxID=2787634 RepID=A0A934W143_9MICO|nr:benzoate/H(+) symporter BenE family transporter [Lacisediminihabitans changchengi]MBK4346488.1 benzoate/H(+) symporter BenE family transporter [Lacisediminihabitans changchengi]
MLQPISAGFVAAVAGFASSFALVIAGLRAVGATSAEASSGLLALCLAVAVVAIVGSLWLRIPLAIAWSTPGAAVLLAARGEEVHFSDAVGAFLISSALIVLCGLWPALGRAIVRIPRPLASAMLAGVLFPICLAPIQAVATLPLLAAPVVIVWLVLFKLAPRWAVPAAMAVAVGAVFVSAGSGWLSGGNLSPALVFVQPTFDPFTILSIGLPLFVVTMAGQNVPGFTVLSTFGYAGPPRYALVATGLGSGAANLFGAHAINLGAITAAIMSGPESHPDLAKRWVATLTNGILYIPLGLAAGVAAALVSAAPTVLITAVAGLAVLGALVTSVVNAMEDPAHRISAIVTFLVVASKVVVLGVGSAFWGLAVGAIVYAWLGWRRRSAASATSELPKKAAG